MSGEKQEKKENLSEKWETWRTKIETDIKEIKASVSSQKSPESNSFEGFIESHVPGCPGCQGILEKAGYTQKQQTKEKTGEIEEKKTPKGSEKASKEEWSVSDAVQEEEEQN